MPDNWSYVFAAYAIAAIVLGGYWRRLARGERELDRRERRAAASATRPGQSEPRPPHAGHSRPEPAARPPVP